MSPLRKSTSLANSFFAQLRGVKVAGDQSQRQNSALPPQNRVLDLEWNGLQETGW